ncbi:DUF3261 domain-containing protein [Neptunicella sp. SCSIO 80796]|uniref:DUF3261 domain-containing protein n=1 Tax=Neptunicella plasticusilytica TaxID=3117012 RepID=UPI003A4DEB43
MRKLIVIIFVSMLSACASHIASQQPVILDDQSQFVLQPVPAVLAGTGRLEKLQISAPDQDHQLLLQIEIFAQQVKMVGFSLSGLVLFEMKWDPVTGLESHTKVPLGDLRPEVLFAYFQLANWPDTAVQRGARGIQLHSEENSRQFYRDEQLVFSIQTTKQTTLFDHHLQHFQIKIDKIKQWKLDEQLD